jgi:hypothetical protein
MKVTEIITEAVINSKELSEEFDLIESIIETIAERNQVDAELIWEDLESLDDDELYVCILPHYFMMSDHDVGVLRASAKMKG